MHLPGSKEPRDWDQRQQIVEEHRQLRATLESAVKATRLDDLTARLETLRELLVRHFATEEAPAGLHESIGDSEPRLLARLRPLNREHSGFLATLDELIDRASQGVQEHFEQIHLDMVALNDRLHDHEARENELLQISVQTDLGTGD